MIHNMGQRDPSTWNIWKQKRGEMIEDMPTVDTSAIKPAHGWGHYSYQVVHKIPCLTEWRRPGQKAV